MSVSGGITNSADIPGLNATVTYHVSIVSVNGAIRSDPPTGPALAARGTSTCTVHARVIVISHIYDCIILLFITHPYMTV